VNEWQRCDQAHPLLPCEQLELAAQRCEAAGLDLDQKVAADEIDDETAYDLLDAIAGTFVPVLELSVQHTLVERPDCRDLSFLGCGDLEDGAHDDAPSSPRRRCLRPGHRPGRAGTGTDGRRTISSRYRAVRAFSYGPASPAVVSQ
jgi:hypothetical protein